MTTTQAKTKLTETFERLAAKALTDNNTTFLDLADKVLRSGALKDIGAVVEPLSESLNEYQESLKAIEKDRQNAYVELKTTLISVSQTQNLLKKETTNLVTALRRPGVRGRWGELTLRRVAELTGMAEHCDFQEQSTIDTEEGQLRPDMIICMPNDLIVPVDAKAPLDAYLDAMGAESDEDRKRYLQRHAGALRERMKSLSSKEYSGQFQKTPDVTVLFLPGDPFLSAALECDPSLLEDAMQKKVLIATPVTLFALLKAVAYGWRQEAITANTQIISDLGKQLYKRISTLWGHLDNLRNGLTRAVEAFDSTVGSIESSVLPSARRFKELGATTDSIIEVLEPVARVPRPLSALIGAACGQSEETNN